jgi:HEAT repeat protein
MLRLSQLLSSRSIQTIRCLTLACSIALPTTFATVTFGQDATATPAATPPATPAPAAGDTTPAAPATPAAGGDATTPAAPAAPAAANPVNLPENEPLKDSIENFWHYGLIARYDVASAEATRILGQNTDPQLLLAMFEAVADVHHDNLDEWLLRWQGVPAMKDVTTQLITVLNKGHEARRADPKYIEENIKLASENERGYDLAIGRLRDSGELAVQFMIDDLRDPAKEQYHPAIRRALRDLGLSAVNPLLAATEMSDTQTLMSVVNVLGDLGYDVAVPYLLRLKHDPKTPNEVKETVDDALHRLRIADPDSLNAADQFYSLAERFYYDNSAVRAEKRYPIGRVWYWTDDKGLTFKEVPQPIFHDVMCKREAEYSLKLAKDKGVSGVSADALSLWLSANYQDEAELPAGQKDPTIPADAPSAHYWGSLSGTVYLNKALSRANKDRNAPVALRIVQSLQDIGGQANLFSGADHPLMDALQFPDRLVRYEAAFALAAALPRDSFIGEERVVPLLAEALSQTGAANVMVVLSNQDQLNATIDGLKTAGYNVVGGTTPEDAVKNAVARPAIDAILTTEDLGPTAIAQLEALAGQTPRLERAVKVILTKTKASPYAVEAISDTTMATTQAKITDYPALKIAIDDARKRGGLLPLDESTAGKYATRAADLLSKIAINRSPVYDVTVAEPLLLSALDDNRPEIVKFTATVLGLMNSPEIQPALLTKASDDHTPDDLKIALFKAVATNARNFGRNLDDDQIQIIQKTVASAPNIDVRTAAGEARGALDLPADQAKKLIIDQAKTSD